MSGLMLSHGPFADRPARREALTLLAALAPLAVARAFDCWPGDGFRLLALLAGSFLGFFMCPPTREFRGEGPSGVLARLAEMKLKSFARRQNVAPGERLRRFKDAGWLAWPLAAALWLPLAPAATFWVSFMVALMSAHYKTARVAVPLASVPALIVLTALGGPAAFRPWTPVALACIFFTAVWAWRLNSRSAVWGTAAFMAAPMALASARMAANGFSGADVPFFLAQAFLTAFLVMPPIVSAMSSRNWRLIWFFLGGFSFAALWPEPLYICLDFLGLYGLGLALSRGGKPAAAAGVSAGAPPPGSARAARLRCAGGGRALAPAVWVGPPSCRLAFLADDGPYACRRACLNLGDCLRACPHGAIGRGARGFVAVDETRCQGCGACAAACPKGLIVLGGRGFGCFIPCDSAASLKETSRDCQAGCLGCGRCRKACPAGAISFAHKPGAAVIDRNVCENFGPGCGQVCAEVCPVKIIVRSFT